MQTGSGPRARILIVDDIPDTVQLLKDWLESNDYEAHGVTSSVQALDVAADDQPDLILLDVMMPRMDGMETCRRLKANPRTAAIPVILVTARNPSDARAEGILAGAVDYITKPVNLMDLVNRIELALSSSRQAPVDVQRLLEEVAHSALTILASDLVWLLSVDQSEQVLKSRILATTAGARVEIEFLLLVANGQSVPRFSLQDATNPLSATLTARKIALNVPTESLAANPGTELVHRACELLRLNYLTVVPLTAVGKTPGVMVLGGVQPHDLETPRARQILTSLASQAGIVLDYSRLITDLTVKETETRREQKFRQMILDTMSDGLVVINAQGVIEFVNRRLLRMTGYSQGSLEGRSVGDLFHPDDRVEVTAGLLREGVATMKFEQRLITRDHRVLPVWLTRSRSQTEELNSQVIVLSDMTEQKRREEELERQTGRLLALNEAAKAITSNLSLHETLQNILDSSLKVVDAQGASVFLFNSDNAQELICVAAAGTGADVMQGMRVPVGEGVAGWVAREARSQLVGDIETDPRFYRGVDEQTGLSTQSLIAAPLINAGRVIGVVEVVNKLNNEFFNQDDVRLLESMAGTAAVSIVNARLFDETRRRVVELGTLLNASEAASSTLQFSQVLESIARNLAEGLEVSRCHIMAWNGPKQRLESLAEIADVTWALEDAPRRSLRSEPVLQSAILTGQPALGTLFDSDLSAEMRTSLLANGMTGLLALPVHDSAGSVIGAICLQSTDFRAPYLPADLAAAHTILNEWLSAFPPLPDGITWAGTDLVLLVNRLLGVERTDWITVRLWEHGAEHTRIIREKGFAEWTRRTGVVLPVQRFPTMQSVIHDQQVHMGTIDSFQDDPIECQWLTYHGGRACMMVPLLERGVTVGVVKLVSQYDREFDQDEVNLAQGISNVVSSAMENARLYQSLDSRARALESAYKELQEADRAKDEFIQNVSHELRTPLIAVLGYAGLMEEGDFGPINDQQQEALGIVVQKSQKLASLVEDIVSIQALETRTYERVSTDLGALISSSVEKFTPRAAESGVTLNMTIVPELSPVMADPSKIADAFERLLDNALKFGAAGGRVEISVDDPGGPMLQVSVQDFGIGIDPSEHQKIFQRFYQVDGGANRRYPGTGLGLALARSIIEGHGGQIEVRSRLENGATFTFTVPKISALA